MSSMCVSFAGYGREVVAPGPAGHDTQLDRCHGSVSGGVPNHTQRQVGAGVARTGGDSSQHYILDTGGHYRYRGGKIKG